MELRAVFFEFSSYKLQETKQDIELKYAVGFEDGKRLEFKEIITLPEAISASSPEFEAVLDKTLHTLHLICGISYYKTYCPRQIIIKTSPLTKIQAEFWSTVYTNGLGEFFYLNKIDFRGLVQFPYSDEVTTNPTPLKRQEKTLMAVGGGKDSVVTFELLKETNLPITVFLLETQKEYELINEITQKMAVDALHIQRTIDPQLFNSKKLEGAYNGHIPITAVYSVIGLLCAVVFDFKYVVFSNEKSANYGNVSSLGTVINHQWSKSEEFEQLFQSYIKNSITPDIFYFSLLRSWTEMKIVEEFIKYPQYFPLFSSCNNNFKVYKESLKDTRWCGNCPKCAFVFSMLAAYLSKEEVVTIFKKNLYADEKLVDLYRELLGIKDFKPFECVGTPDEVKAAFYKAVQEGKYKNDVIMKLFEAEVLPSVSEPEKLIKLAEEKGDNSLIPEKFRSLFS